MALHCELHLECIDPAVNSIASLHIKGNLKRELAVQNSAVEHL